MGPAAGPRPESSAGLELRTDSSRAAPGTRAPPWWPRPGRARDTPTASTGLRADPGSAAAYTHRQQNPKADQQVKIAVSYTWKMAMGLTARARIELRRVFGGPEPDEGGIQQPGQHAFREDQKPPDDIEQRAVQAVGDLFKQINEFHPHRRPVEERGEVIRVSPGQQHVADTTFQLSKSYE